MTPFDPDKYRIRSFSDEYERLHKLPAHKPSKNRKNHSKRVIKESTRRCIKILKRLCKEEFNSWEELAKALQVKRMTIYRWIRDK